MELKCPKGGELSERGGSLVMNLVSEHDDSLLRRERTIIQFASVEMMMDSDGDLCRYEFLRGGVGRWKEFSLLRLAFVVRADLGNLGEEKSQFPTSKG